MEKAAFFVSDKRHYDHVQESRGEDAFQGLTLLKEWEINHDGLNRQPDLAYLAGFEREFADPVLWNALIADRRIVLGKKAALVQDYNTQYSHAEMLAVLEKTARELVHVFDQIAPRVVVGFICVTLADYLAFLIAKRRGIRFVNLRPTRVSNYFVAGDTVNEPSTKVRAVYSKTYDDLLEPSDTYRQNHEEAAQYIAQCRRASAMYEGVIPASSVAEKIKSKFALTARLQGIVHTVRKALAQDIVNCTGPPDNDNYYRPGIYWLWLEKVLKPKRLREIFSLSTDWAALSEESFAFYPLHKEPEVTMLVYGRHCLNQIEVIRNLARSLPVGMKLVFKEHPVAIGYRAKSYYEALLAIPNVVMVSPEMDAKKIIEKAKLVAVISGSIGFEAILRQKPVITMGNAPFNILPPTMVRHVPDLSLLSEEINDLLRHSEHDEMALYAYVMSIMDVGIPINFYSGLLEREGAYRGINVTDHPESRSRDIKRLAQYVWDFD